MEQAKTRKQEYLEWIKKEIEEAIQVISSFDLLYVLGGLGAKLLKSTPTFYNQFLANYEGENVEEYQEDLQVEDDEIEVILEYAMSIATALPNANSGKLPSQENIDDVYERLARIKFNTGVYEMANGLPDADEFDRRLRTNVVLDSIHVRGSGFSQHFLEVYKELFGPHNAFLEEKYGFNAHELLDTILKLDTLVYSKVGNAGGSIQANKRFDDWLKTIGGNDALSTLMHEKRMPFFQLFAEAHPDLRSESNPHFTTGYRLDNVTGYNKLFWVIPENPKEEAIFAQLAQPFGDNAAFFQPEAYKAFPLNDTSIKLKPLIQEGGKYYCFSLTLAYRNAFKIAEALIKNADSAYYSKHYMNNARPETKDNYVERKVLALFRKMLPTVSFYHSLDYKVAEDGMTKDAELDILGMSADSLYLIEVKAGELNVKQRRGFLKGLKDRIADTIAEGSSQCTRALRYIDEAAVPSFSYAEGGTRHTLNIDRARFRHRYKITVTFEHYSAVSVNLQELIETGILSNEYKWVWVVSLYDLMVFADLLTSETDLQDYLAFRIPIYERQDIQFIDEVEILGFFLDGLQLPDKDDRNRTTMTGGYADEIEEYYEKHALGMPSTKPRRKQR